MNEPEYSRFTPPAENVRKVLVHARHYSVAEQTRFLRILNKEKCDLMHFTHFNAPLFYKGKFVTTIHDTTISFYPGKKMNSWWRKLAYRKVIEHAIHGAERVITVSDNTKQDVLELFSLNTPESELEQKITTIWNGLGLDFYPVDQVQQELVRTKYDLGDLFLLYTGNWREHKNLVRLLQAFKKMIDKAHSPTGIRELQNLQLVITGNPDPYYPEVLGTISDLGLEKQVKTVGLVPVDDLLRLYGAATVFVFPSLYEGFGFPPLEAMRTETPVAASRISAIPEVCGEAVQYFDPEDVDDMAHQIETLLLDHELQDKLVHAGKDRVQQFSWDQCAAETLAVYEEALGNTP